MISPLRFVANIEREMLEVLKIGREAFPFVDALSMNIFSAHRQDDQTLHDCKHYYNVAVCLRNRFDCISEDRFILLC